MGKIIPKIQFIFISYIIFSFVTPTFALTKKNTKQAQIYRDEGYKAQRSGNLDMALSYYQRAIEINSDYATVYNDIGVILEAKGDSKKAKEAYLKAISLDSKLLSAYYNLAALYEKDQDYAKAASYWRIRVQLGDWSDAWTWRAKENLESLKASGKLGEKGKLSESDLGLGAGSNSKRDAEYHSYQGRQHVALGDYVNALKEFDKAIMLDPNNEELERLVEETERRVLLYH
jgi:Flp pilus assembly protein TadD